MNALRLVSAAGAAAGAAAWALAERADRRAVAADPEAAFLADPPHGRPLPVTAPDGTRLHAEVFGPDDAPPLVLVHGWTCALRFWAYQERDLAGPFRVIAYDLRGHGRSAAAAGGDWSMEAHAGDLAAVLEAALAPGERAVVAGHSLGAMTIVAWAGVAPAEVEGRVRAAALIDTGLGDLISEALVVGGPVRARSVLGRALLGVPAPLPGRPSPLSRRAIHHIALGPAAGAAAIDFSDRMVLGTRRDARAGVGATLTRLDLLESVERLSVPTLVVSSACDRLTPPVHARRIAERLPQLIELVELPEAGHMGPLEAPDVVNARLRALGEADFPLRAASSSREALRSAGGRA